MADYKELWSLKHENQRLSETNKFLKEEINNIFDKMTDPEMSVANSRKSFRGCQRLLQRESA